ncbi:hypothetical protein HN371_06380 [Candidatus Poribacteria bacterium]|nr:hypothetical protein [Candidatus Poribacteria bacterium]MBT5713434.1 hypothetical protein [Candidatus Poribacteria bacterium]MBT7806765.1 hypothetical protein [Candidatus Poribacteria bacterium]
MAIVPADAVAVVRIHDVERLTDDIDMLANLVSPLGPESSGILPRAIAGFVRAGFTSNADLAELGLRLDTGIVFVFLAPDVDSMAAVVGVRDQATVRAQLMQRQKLAAKEYEGLPYMESHDAAFAFVDSLLLYTKSPGLMPRLLDVARGAEAPLLRGGGEDSRPLSVLTAGADIAVYANVDAMETAAVARIEEWGGPATDGGSADEADQAAQDSLRQLVTDLDEVGITVQIDDTSIIVDTETRPRPGSPWAEQATAPNRPLARLTSLPADAFLVTSSIVSGAVMRSSIVEATSKQMPPAPEPIARAFTAAAEAIPGDYVGEVTLTARVADAVFPDIICVVPVEQASQLAFDDALSTLYDDLVAAASTDSPEETVAWVSKTVAHHPWGVVNGWEVTFAPAAFRDVPAPVQVALPAEIGLWHTFVDDYAFVVVSTSSKAVTDAVQRHQGGGETVQHKLPAALLAMLPAEGSSGGYISPNLAVKSIARALGGVVPEAQALNAVTQFLPEEHSIGIVSINRGDGVSTRVVLDVAGLAPLAQVLAAAAASAGRPPGAPPPLGRSHRGPGDQPHAQWATSVLGFSSEYGRPEWAATQALGVPNTFSYGDIPTAWAPSPGDGGMEYLVLGYSEPVHAVGAVIRETHGNGFVRRVDVLDEHGALHTVWAGEDSSPSDVPHDLLVTWPRTEFPVTGLKIWVDTGHNARGREAIDAVRLLGSPGAPRPKRTSP